MKTVIICITLMIFSSDVFSQPSVPSAPAVQTDFLRKSKQQKTGAWVLLGSGFVASTIGILTATLKAAEDVAGIYTGIFSGNPQPQNNYTVETILLVSGVTAMLSSVPLFVAASKNKRKGMSVSIKNESALIFQKSSLSYRTFPSLTLKISL